MKIHMDLDCFFASCERTKNPMLMGKPIAVGGRSDVRIFEKGYTQRKLYNQNSGAFVPNVFYSNKQQWRAKTEEYFFEKTDHKTKIRGIITTASYEARAYKIKTGMTINEALQLCPKLIVLPPNHLLYHELSHQLAQFLATKIPLLEQYSIDEFFGDLSGWVKDEDMVSYCEHLKDEILKRFGLPISFGIAQSKWAAKLATTHAKPFGVCQIKPEEWDAFIREMKIEQFPGISKGYKKRLNARGIETLGDIKEAKALFYSWKKPGIQLYKRVQGIDEEQIHPQHPRKSIGISRTFDPIKKRDEVLRRAVILARNLTYTTLHLGLNPTTYYMKIRYEVGLKEECRISVERLFHERFFKALVIEMFSKIDKHHTQAIKYIGLSVSNFMEYKNRPYDLLHFDKDTKHNKLSHSIQTLRDKYGIDVVKTANEI
ncbi:DNA polymerase Y family protein [Sulfurospirillum sp. 1612]|uniref:DNA polymerase Y family protein n=1 Tax=Sulfurospirillum sp. 1612 TaxID=3094835 RepID=UPI002F93088F